MKRRSLTARLPNLVTGSRLVLSGILLLVAYHGYSTAFIVILAAAFFTDALDGLLARLLGATSEFGARLDSVVDFIFYLCIPVATWWLWPGLIRDEWPFFTAVLASICLPPLVAIVKLSAVTSYHTWGARLGAATVGIGLLLLYVTGIAWPFRIGAVVCVLAALEELAITLVLDAPRSDVRTVWHVLRSRRR